MTTTAALVEILVVGFLALGTFIPLTLYFPEPTTEYLIQHISKLQLFPLLTIAYAIGIVWNRVCDEAFEVFDRRIVSRRFKSHIAYQTARLQVVAKNENLQSYLETQRSMIRVARAASVLLFVYLVTIISFLISPCLISKYLWPLYPYLFRIFTLTLLLFMLSVFAWYKLRSGYISAIAQAFVIIINTRKLNELFE